MHLTRKVLQLLASVLQALPLHMVVGCMRQKLVQSDDVTRNLHKDKRLISTDYNKHIPES